MSTPKTKHHEAKTSPSVTAGAAKLRTFIISSYPPEHKIQVIKIVCEHSGLSPQEAKDLIDGQAAITFPTLEVCNDAVVALGEIGVDFAGGDEPAPTADAAHEAWVDLDESDNKMRAARSLLLAIKIACRHPDHQLNGDIVADSLGVLDDLLAIIADNIDIARDRVRTLDATVSQVSS